MLFFKPPADTSPTFCPLCRKPGNADSELCAECGETLIPQGFCPTCEAHWRLPSGDDCPKHELPLLAERPPLPASLQQAEVINWVPVASFALPFEAEAARIRLDAEGIPAFLDGLRMGMTYSHPISGGIKLQVPREMQQEARVLLSQSWAAPFDDEEEEEAIDWEETPGQVETDWRAAVLGWGTLLVLALIVLGILGWIG